MNTSFYVANLWATYGGWVLYRDGELFAQPFESKLSAIHYAESFCRMNGLRISWGK